MTSNESTRNRLRVLRRTKGITTLVAVLTGLAVRSDGQGTMTVNFDGQPPGTFGTISACSESGLTFWNPYGPENLARIGPSLSGAPQDGTAYLAVTGGADLAFSFNSAPTTYFDFLSFGAAGESTDFPGASLEVVGYKGMSGTVTNFFTVASFLNRRANNLPDFQTFYLDAQFQHVFRVDVLTDRWSLDNLVVGGVPEPSCGALVLLGAACVHWFRRAWQPNGRG